METQWTATDDVVVGDNLRQGMDEVQNKPDDCVDETKDSCEACKPVAGVARRRHVDDKSK